MTTFRDLASKLWPLKLNVTEAPVLPDLQLADDTMVEQGVAGRVILYNDNNHTFDEVGLQLAKAIGCSWDEGEAIAWEVHAHGRAEVFSGEVMACLRVSSVLEEIALLTQVMT
jgi:ATP-dependent Clp protease adaptor protein ClpS